NALVGRLRGADPRLGGGEVGRRVHHVVGRDVARGLELQRREQRVREGRRLLIAHAERVGMTGRRDGEQDQQRDQRHKKTSHGNGSNLFRWFGDGQRRRARRLCGCAGRGLVRINSKNRLAARKFRRRQALPYRICTNAPTKTEVTNAAEASGSMVSRATISRPTSTAAPTIAAAMSPVSCGGSVPATIPAPSAGSSNSVRIVPAFRRIIDTVCGSCARKAKYARKPSATKASSVV